MTKGESKLPADTMVRRHARSSANKEARGAIVYSKLYFRASYCESKFRRVGNACKMARNEKRRDRGFDRTLKKGKNLSSQLIQDEAAKHWESAEAKSETRIPLVTKVGKDIRQVGEGVWRRATNKAREIFECLLL